MARHGGGRRRRGGGGHGDDGHPDERWLLTYSDLITLLMALFMVLFSISSVNKSKFESLQHALQDAFSGRILPGGKSIKEAGGTDNIANPSPSAPESSLQPYVGGRPQEMTGKGGATAQQSAAQRAAAVRAEQQQFTALKAKVDALVAAKGLSGKVKTRITDRGLVIRLLTDDLLFDSASATPRPDSIGLLHQLGHTLTGATGHQLLVEGHTDSVPIHSRQYPTNWELSTARASSVVRAFAGGGMDPARMTAAGRAYLDPVAPNATPAGRSLNRRVEILVPRVAGLVPAGSSPVTGP